MPNNNRRVLSRLHPYLDRLLDSILDSTNNKQRQRTAHDILTYIQHELILSPSPQILTLTAGVVVDWVNATGSGCVQKHLAGLHLVISLLDLHTEHRETLSHRFIHCFKTLLNQTPSDLEDNVINLFARALAKFAATNTSLSINFTIKIMSDCIQWLGSNSPTAAAPPVQPVTSPNIVSTSTTVSNTTTMITSPSTTPAGSTTNRHNPSSGNNNESHFHEQHPHEHEH